MAITTDQLRELRDDILHEVYQEADPPLDWRDAANNPDDYPDFHPSNHVLSNERQREIREKHIAGHDLSDRQQSQLTFAVVTEWGPRDTEVTNAT